MNMQEIKKRNKELLEEVEKLKRQVKILKARKKYGLVWEEEKEPEQIVLDCQVKIPILKEVKSKEIISDKEKSVNILIEGDNYHALSVLNYTHKKKIDVIYIDPPYNTGNKDFKYNDKWVDSEYTYKHSKWLSFMEKRLNLAKLLLRDTGAIFISIDSNEFAQLKMLCDEIFLPQNFVNVIVWKKTNSPKAQSNQLGNQHEYVLFYARDITRLEINKFVGTIDENYKAYFNYNDNDGRGHYQTVALVAGGSQRSEKRKSFEFHGITDQWLYNKDTLEKWWQEGRIHRTNSGKYRLKKYLSETEGRLLSDIWIDDEIKPLQGGSSEYIGFTTQKPISLIKRILKLFYNKDLVVLDFFAGSGTTGLAVLDLNKDDKGNRKFVLCNNNEDNNGDGKKICSDILFPRVKESLRGIKMNLRYFKTELLDIDHISHVSDEQKIKLTYRAGEMIALREGAFIEVEKDEWWQIFRDGTKYTAIYFKEDKRKLNELVKKLSKLKEKVVLYIFSWGKNEYKNEFTEYKNIKVEDIPEPIIDVYKEVNRLS